MVVALTACALFPLALGLIDRQWDWGLVLLCYVVLVGSAGFYARPGKADPRARPFWRCIVFAVMCAGGAVMLDGWNAVVLGLGASFFIALSVLALKRASRVYKSSVAKSHWLP